MRISDWSSDVCSSDLADVSFETALRARIKALPEVVSAASSVDWSVRPQGAFTSSIVLTVAYDPRGRTMTGWRGWIPTRVYFDVLAASAPVKATPRDAMTNLLGHTATEGRTLILSDRDSTINHPTGPHNPHTIQPTPKDVHN